jgi:hypothetical protein
MFLQAALNRQTSQSIVSVDMFLGLPYHTPHREARFRRAEKILHTLVLESHLVKELIDVPTTSTNQHRDHPQRMQWRDDGATIGSRWRKPNIYISKREGGFTSHYGGGSTRCEIESSTGGTANRDGK